MARPQAGRGVLPQCLARLLNISALFVALDLSACKPEHNASVTSPQPEAHSADNEPEGASLPAFPPDTLPSVRLKHYLDTHLDLILAPLDAEGLKHSSSIINFQNSLATEMSTASPIPISTTLSPAASELVRWYCALTHHPEAAIKGALFGVLSRARDAYERPPGADDGFDWVLDDVLQTLRSEERWPGHPARTISMPAAAFDLPGVQTNGGRRP